MKLVKLIFNGEEVALPGPSSGASDDVYSTEETRIGMWVDGKPLYRKTIHKDSVSPSEEIPISEYMETLVSAECCAFNGAYTVFAPYSGQDGYFYIYFGTGEAYIKASVEYSNFNLSVKYTKTTDQPENSPAIYEWWSPMMTSDTEPPPYLAAASTVAGVHKAFHAFDSNPNTIWHSTMMDNSYIIFNFSAKTTIKGISISAAGVIGSFDYSNFIPQKISVYGANDGEYEFIQQFATQNEPAGIFQEFVFSEPKTYKKYKIKADGPAHSGQLYFICADIKFYKRVQG